MTSATMILATKAAAVRSSDVNCLDVASFSVLRSSSSFFICVNVVMEGFLFLVGRCDLPTDVFIRFPDIKDCVSERDRVALAATVPGVYMSNEVNQ